MPTTGQTTGPSGDIVDTMPKNMVVSRPIDTAGGRLAWVEQDPAAQFTVICDGCGLSEYRAGLAPALARVSEHAEQCTATRG